MNQKTMATVSYSLWYVNDDLDIVDREESSLTMHAALEPVLVDALCQLDRVTFLETKLALILWVKIVQCFTAWLLLLVLLGWRLAIVCTCRNES